MKNCLALVLLVAFSSCASSEPPRSVYLLGRFSAPHHRPELANQLRERGHQVCDAMAPGVDLVVVGQDPVNATGTAFTPVVDTAEYRLAKALGAEILPRDAAIERFGLARR